MPSDLASGKRELLSAAAAQLAGSGVESPRREAQRIWADVAVRGAAAFAVAVERRANGEPLAHVTGLAGFRHLEVASDRRALIPRPETEGLVELLLGAVRTGRVVDVGTGTGCIALSLAREGAFSEVVASDVSAEALALARENRDRHGLAVSMVRGDLCAPFRLGAFDALISNPPYLTWDEYATLDSSVRDWEPREALVGGPDGLESTTRLLQEARGVLKPGGWMALELDWTRAAVTASRAAALGWSDLAIHADLFGRERYLLARRSETQ